jgi:hypothetical protein
MILNVDAMKKVFDMLMDKTYKAGFDVVNLDTDFYWTILASERSKMNEDALQPAVGSTVDDIEHLIKILDGTYEVSRPTAMLV